MLYAGLSTMCRKAYQSSPKPILKSILQWIRMACLSASMRALPRFKIGCQEKHSHRSTQKIRSVMLCGSRMRSGNHIEQMLSHSIPCQTLDTNQQLPCEEREACTRLREWWLQELQRQFPGACVALQSRIALRSRSWTCTAKASWWSRALLPVHMLSLPAAQSLHSNQVI